MRALFLAFVTSAVVSRPDQARPRRTITFIAFRATTSPAESGECTFMTKAQCQASASGRTAYCTENRNFSANAQLTDKSRPRHRSH